MKKLAQVVMLPTNEKASLKLGQNGLLVNNTFGYDSHFTNQHLYILSDEEIKEEDWFLMNGCIVRQCSLHKGDVLDTIGGLHHESVCKKIIATTDRSLGLVVDQNGCPMQAYSKFLPQPSQSFIEYFVEEYNKGNVITEVMVEYESIGAYANPKYNSDYQLKINLDNTINISMPKERWSREEVVELLYKHTEYMLSGKKDTLDKWIKENL